MMKNIILENINRLHTTSLGEARIKKNLSIKEEDVVLWCKNKILSSETKVYTKGKNLYVEDEYFIFTIHAHSFTIITAHKK